MSKYVKQVPNFPDYWCDIFGNVYSTKKNCGTNLRMLKPAVSKKGYYRVHLRTGLQSVHKLVALAFLGENPDKLHVDHINGNKWDNRVCNLRYCTDTENKRFRNRTKMSRSGYSNILLNRNGTYTPQFKKKGVVKTFGRYKTIEEALEVRNKIYDSEKI